MKPRHGGVFPNVADRDLVNPASAYYGANLDRRASFLNLTDPERVT
jgi:hypothetical protein